MTFRRCRASISPIVQRRFGEVEKGFRAERKAASGGAEKCHAETDVPGSGDGVHVCCLGGENGALPGGDFSRFPLKGNHLLRRYWRRRCAERLAGEEALGDPCARLFRRRAQGRGQLCGGLVPPLRTVAVRVEAEGI